MDLYSKVSELHAPTYILATITSSPSVRSHAELSKSTPSLFLDQNSGTKTRRWSHSSSRQLFKWLGPILQGMIYIFVGNYWFYHFVYLLAHIDIISEWRPSLSSFMSEIGGSIGLWLGLGVIQVSLRLLDVLIFGKVQHIFHLLQAFQLMVSTGSHLWQLKTGRPTSE